MLNGVHIVDFGNHRNTRLTFGPMTALVGQNGSGKTTVMRALTEVGKTWTNGEHEVDKRFARRSASQAIITASWPGELEEMQSDIGIRLAENSAWLRRIRLPRDFIESWIPDPFAKVPDISDTPPLFPSLDNDNWTSPAPGEIRRTDHAENRSGATRYFKTSATSLQGPAVAEPTATTLNDDGSNLAWALASLMTESPDRFQRILDSLREVVPIVKRIRARSVVLKRTVKQAITINKQDRLFDEERDVNGQELIFDMKSGDGLPATAVSEGTLVVLAVLTLVHGSDAELIMLDDVELGLHPKAQRDLIRQLQRIQKTHANLQIIVSTHSPYVVDEFKPEDVWVFAPDKEGCAVTKRLSEHPDAERALEVLSTGEFWSAEGEPWVLDEEPAARVAEDAGR